MNTYEPISDERREELARATAIGRERSQRPFSFEDLPYRDGKRVEPESWGPKYSKPPQPGRKVDVDRWPTNAPSGQKTAHVCDKKFRAKLRAEFEAQANADRVGWATGKLSLDRVGLHGGIVEAYKAAMAAKRERLAREALPVRFPLGRAA
jgi:hypothetical protein